MKRQIEIQDSDRGDIYGSVMEIHNGVIMEIKKRNNDIVDQCGRNMAEFIKMLNLDYSRMPASFRISYEAY